MTFGHAKSRIETANDLDVSDRAPVAARDEWGLGRTWTSMYRAPVDTFGDNAPVGRVIDILGALAILIIAFPFLAVLALLMKIDSPGSLFFVQQRIGRGGRVFPCIKFRTMCRDADLALQRHLASSSEARAEWARDHKLRDDPRITRMGKIVRKLSLDEFPQLINVLRGEMSLVGPRPIVRSEVPRYGRYFDEYCKVRPGLTGLWQVSGRNNVSYRRRVSIDCYYVRNKSLAFDLSILMRTVPVVIFAKGY
ncbi:MAG: sugar transferase [Sphingomonadaceae bacterium]